MWYQTGLTGFRLRTMVIGRRSGEGLPSGMGSWSVAGSQKKSRVDHDDAVGRAACEHIDRCIRRTRPGQLLQDPTGGSRCVDSRKTKIERVCRIKFVGRDEICEC